MRSKLLIPTLFLLWSCGSDDNSPESISQTLLASAAYDLGDSNGAGDIRVDLELEAGHNLTGIKAFIVPQADRNNVTTENASALAANLTQSIPVSGEMITARLNAGLSDWNGNAISNGNTYQVMFLLEKGERVALAASSSQVALTDVPYLTGRYEGTWNDNLYTDFAITANLTFENDTLSGPFYYSALYTACCGGSDDGEIEVTFNQQSVTFVYNQTLQEFMGGRCNGTYTGTGQLQEDIVLSIDFAGDDCEGPHTNGRIVLTRVL